MMYTLEPAYGTRYFYLLNKQNGKYIIIRHGHISITRFEYEENEEFLESLSKWDPIGWKMDLKGGYYLEENKEFRIPRGYPIPKLKEWFPHHKVVIDNMCFQYDEISVKLFKGPRDDRQKLILAHMLGKDPYYNVKDYSCQVIDADTGDGKTYMSTAAGVYKGNKIVIFIPIDKLFKQWVSAFEEFTSIKKDDIAIIKGYDKCKKILDGKYKDKKVFLISVDTFSSYIDRVGDMDAVLTLQAMRTGTMFIDECHRELRGLMKIIALSNFKMNYFLTSSFGRADKRENAIFKEMFRFIPKIGKNLKKNEEKHIEIAIATYKYNPTMEEQRKIYIPRVGLNSNSYEKMILEGPGLKKFIPCLHSVFEFCKEYHEDGKTLILTSSIAGAEKMAKVMKVLSPDAKIGIYHSKISKSEKENISDNDIICSTVASLGTGSDFSDLQFVINIAAYSNAIWADQIPGRLRDIRSKGFKNIFYFELVNILYKKTNDQYKRRLPYLAKKAVDGRIGTLECD